MPENVTDLKDRRPILVTIGTAVCTCLPVFAHEIASLPHGTKAILVTELSPRPVIVPDTEPFLVCRAPGQMNTHLVPLSEYQWKKGPAINPPKRHKRTQTSATRTL